MTRNRKYWFSQYFHVKDLGGVQMLMPVFDDLTDSQLAKQYAYYFEREDYDYLAHIVAEGNLRGIKFSNSKTDSWQKKS